MFESTAPQEGGVVMKPDVSVNVSHLLNLIEMMGFCIEGLGPQVGEELRGEVSKLCTILDGMEYQAKILEKVLC
jgi:hypothetical protein